MKPTVVIAIVLAAVAMITVGAKSLMPSGSPVQPIQAVQASTAAIMNPFDFHLKADMKILPVSQFKETP